MRRELLLLEEMTEAAEQAQRLRNRIVHGYWSVDLDVLHTTAQSRPPGFAADVRHVLALLTEEDASSEEST
jgi:uncharacterized protein YutE (UPF0331/DUF86 family)